MGGVYENVRASYNGFARGMESGKAFARELLSEYARTESEAHSSSRVGTVLRVRAGRSVYTGISDRRTRSRHQSLCGICRRPEDTPRSRLAHGGLVSRHRHSSDPNGIQSGIWWNRLATGCSPLEGCGYTCCPRNGCTRSYTRPRGLWRGVSSDMCRAQTGRISRDPHRRRDADFVWNSGAPLGFAQYYINILQ